MGAARFVCRLQLAAGLSLLGLLSFGSSAPAQARRAVTPAGRVTEFTAGLRSAYGSPQYIARGRDGNLWFTTATSAFATVGGAIGRITPKGRITEFSTGAGTPSGIAAGADGNIWFTTAAAIGRMTPKGDITYFPLTESLGQAALGIALGSDRNMWFTVTGCQHLVQDCWIGRITPTGQITEFSAGMHSSQSAPYDIALGPDGNMWFTDNGCVGNGPCAIGRITPRGEITEFGAIESGDEPVFIAPGPDRAMWFTESAANGGPPGVGRITTTGKASFFYTYQAAGRAGNRLQLGLDPAGIASGPGGWLWISDSGCLNGPPLACAVGRFRPGHGVGLVDTLPAIHVSWYYRPFGTRWSPGPIAQGADRNMWFTSAAVNRAAVAIGRITTGSR